MPFFSFFILLCAFSSHGDSSDYNIRRDLNQIVLDSYKEFKSNFILCYIIQEGHLDEYVEDMKGYNPDLSEKFVSSCEDDIVQIGGVDFVVTMETIVVVIGVLDEGKEMPHNSNVHYKPNIKNFLGPSENVPRLYNGFNGLEVPG